MYLTIDIGNTFTKVAVFSKEKMVSTAIQPTGLFEGIEDSIDLTGIKHCIISIVGNVSMDGIRNVLKDISITVLDRETRIPFANLYTSPQTLGYDRLAAAAGAVHLFPNTNCLVIDAGTTITYEYVQKAKYIGGSIAPGIAMRFKSLHAFTEKLPLQKLTNKTHFDLIGKNTEACIEHGVLRGTLLEIEGHIAAFKQENKEGVVILTGGDSAWIAETIKMEVHLDPFLTLKGLYNILMYNL